MSKIQSVNGQVGDCAVASVGAGVVATENGVMVSVMLSRFDQFSGQSSTKVAASVRGTDDDLRCSALASSRRRAIPDGWPVVRRW